MNADDPILQELGVLLAALVDGGLSADQRGRLSELLRKHPEAKRFYQRYVELHAMLEWESGAVAAQGSDGDTLGDLLRMESEAQAEMVHQVGQLRSPDNTPWHIGGAMRWTIERPALIGGIAAVLALALVLIVFFSGPSNTPSNAPAPLASTPQDEPVVVATLTATHNAQWAEGASAPGSAPRPGDALAAGQRLNLTAGFAEITTNRGAVAIIEAPATIELLDNDNALRLHSGKLVGICETESSKGFLVRTPHLDVIDLGTEFGVEVRADAVEVCVFTGEVNLAVPGITAQPLTSNRAARFVTDTGQLEHIAANQQPQDFTRRTPRHALVNAVHINMDNFAGEVVPMGVVEGARICTDRSYRLTAIDPQGLPTELLQGDLVRLPGSLRTGITPAAKDLRIELDFAAPAQVYLLWAAKEKVLPNWLTSAYTLTPMQVGLDSGRNQTMNVWQRNEPATGRVEVGRSMPEQSSYSIIVTPAALAP
jgi:anti-sigma factor RsiW